MRLRLVLAVGAVEVAIACSTFSADDPAVAPASDAGGDAVVEDVVPVVVVNDAAPADAGIDAPSPHCSGFDVDAASQPPSDLCNGEQKTLAGDPKNCGLCGHVCLDALVCTLGTCQPFAIITSGAGSGLDLQRVDDTDIYWLDRGVNAVFRAPSASQSSESTAAKLAAVSPIEPVSPQAYNIVVDDRIYVKTYGALYQAPLDGGELTPFTAVLVSAGATPLAASGSHLLQTAQQDSVFIDFAKADGGLVAKQNAIGGAYDLTVTPDGRYAFVIGRNGVDAGTAGGSPITRGGLYRYTIATADMTLVTAFDAVPHYTSVLAADNDFVYFPEALAGSILQLPVDAPSGTMPTVLSKGNGRRVGRITTDEGRVYWFASDEAPDFYYWSLLSVDKCGGSERTHLRSHDNGSFLPIGPIVHGPYLYFSTGESIYRIAK